MRTTRGFATPLLLRLMGTHGRLAQSRVCRFGVSDRAALADSGRRVIAFAPTRLVVAHGDVVGPLAPGALELALARRIAAPGQVPSAA